MNSVLNISSSPHVRDRISTRSVMVDILIALLPVTLAGIWIHKLSALLVILVSVGAAVGSEYLFDRITRRENTVTDFSAAVTGLLLALTLPASVPLYIPALGAVFAIIVVKCLFGGLGHNIMNPALSGRCFLLVSFGAVMNNYTLDAVTAATPLAQIAAGEPVQLLDICIGRSSGVIGSSAFGLIIGGIYLLIRKGITLEIPLSMILSNAIFMALFGGRGLDLTFLAAHILGGGLLMAAIFMATDPVTCPSTTVGQIAFGIFTGILIGIFRIRGSAVDSTTYAILIADLVGPIIDDVFIPTPYAYRIPKDLKKKIPKPVIIMLIITLAAGLVLSSVYVITKNTIAENAAMAELEAYQQVLPEAESLIRNDEIQEALEDCDGQVYGSTFGKSYILDAVEGLTADGTHAGWIIHVSNGDAYDGSLSLVVGILPDGTVNAIAFTDLHESAGMGMNCDEPAFKDQFAGATVSSFTLNKTGGSTQPDQIDSVSGASVTSAAVVSAVNAALDFCGTLR